MAVKLLKSSAEEAVFTIEIDAVTIENAIMEEFTKATKGQQQGPKVPLSNRAMLAQHPELDKIAGQALNNVLPRYYMQAIKELGLTPMTFPQIKPRETKLGEPCLVEIRVALEPKIPLQQYEGLQATYAPVIVTEDDVTQQLAGIRQQRGAGDDDAKLLATLPFDSIEAFSAEVRSSLQTMATEKTAANKREAVLNKLVEVNPCSVREEVIEQQTMMMINQFRQQVGANNFEGYLKSSGRTIDDAKKEIRPEAEAAVRKNLLLSAVADKIAPEISEEDIKAVISKQENSIMEVGMSYADRRKRIEETPGALEQLTHAIRLEKAVDFIVRKAVLTETEPMRILDQLPEHMK